MFSREESAIIRQEFWTSFGKSFPRKWLLYNTKIKGLSFKFVADRKKAMLTLDLEHSDEIFNQIIYEQLIQLKSLLKNNYLSEVIFDDHFELDNGKIIHRIYVIHKSKFSIHNKDTWRECYEFFVKNMTQFELFFHEYEDVVKNAL